MISLDVYKLLHILGILLTWASLGGLVVHSLSGGTKATNAARRLVAVSYGIGLFLILLGGFGMLARLGLTQGGMPGWIWVKLAIWAAVGALLALPYRRPRAGRAIWTGAMLLGLTAAWLGLFKPF